ncbi:MAG: hypothetical protein KAS18_08570 [Calditrichia bacterium]|nr:hypothetical protein [Calditrichia bacterium]
MKIYVFFVFIIIISCNQQSNDKQFPEQIGIYKINSIVKGDSAVKEINILHQLSVVTKKNIIIRYGINSEDILYISKFKDNSDATEVFEAMVSKMQANKNIPFSYLIPMKNYDNSYMTLGLGSVHYIYRSGEFLLWFSTKQKFYNEIPEDLLKIYPAN